MEVHFLNGEVLGMLINKDKPGIGTYCRGCRKDVCECNKPTPIQEIIARIVQYYHHSKD